VDPRESNPIPCAVDGCEVKRHAHGYCSRHASAYRKHGDPLAEGRLGRKRLIAPGYDGAHKRVTRERGPATLLWCVDCGSPADEWSYAGDSPHELSTATGLLYSPRIEDYEPRCRPCHRRKDRSLIRPRDELGRFAPGALITISPLY
jgi:hypothetical protein